MMNRRFWQAQCQHCDYVTGPYYEDEWNNAEHASLYDVAQHIQCEHKGLEE